MATQLNNGLAEEILKVADTIYLLFSEPLFIPMETVYKRIRTMKNLMTMLDERIYLDTCITLRTGLIKDKTLYLQAGGGVVAESDPEAEYEETCNKAEALMVAANQAHRYA